MALSIIDIAKAQQKSLQQKRSKDLEKRTASVELQRQKAIKEYGKLKDTKLTQNQYVLQVLAKAANRKMVALEKGKGITKKQEELYGVERGKGINTPALQEAKKWLSLNTDRKKFSTNPAKLDSDEVEQELYHVMKFLRAKSSTTTGHFNIIKKRNETFDKALNLTEEQRDKLYQDLSKKKYGTKLKLLSSDQVIELYRNDETRTIVEDVDLEELTEDQKRRINRLVGQIIFDDMDEVREKDDDGYQDTIF